MLACDLSMGTAAVEVANYSINTNLPYMIFLSMLAKTAQWRCFSQHGHYVS